MPGLIQSDLRGKAHWQRALHCVLNGRVRQLCNQLLGLAALLIAAGAQASGGIPPWPSQLNSDRILAPYLWQGIDGPDAMLAPVGETPVFEWHRLINWSCDVQADEARRERCVQRYLDGNFLPVSTVRQIGTQQTGIPEQRQYTVQFRSGERDDVVFLQGTTALPIELEDGSKIEALCIEDLVALPPTPWGDSLAPVSYTHGVGHRCLRYFRRVLPDRRTVWSNVFLLRADGSLTDRTRAVAEENPVLEFFDLRAVLASDMGILRSWVSPDPLLSFGAVSVGVDLINGNLLSRDHRLIAVPSQRVANLYSTTVSELLREGRINARNTAPIAEQASTQSGLRNLGKAQRVFEGAIRRALIDTYFNMKFEEGTK
jgi:hypothetical protein